MTNPPAAATTATEKVADKTPAKKPAAKRTPATVTAISEKAKAPAPKLPYSATGRSGRVSTRSFPQVMTHAVDVADPGNGRTEAAEKGLIWSFHPSK